MLRKLADGIAAGIMISLGGSVFLAVRGQSAVAAAVLFSVALICICTKGFLLFTGRVGYMVESHKREDWSALLLGLFGNFAGTAVCGAAIRFAFSDYAATAADICGSKLEQSLPGAAIRAIFCGILMYLAVSVYREKQSIVGIVFCIPVFILSGFEHSIADMFYFAVSGIVSWPALGYIFIIILGNALGGILIPLLGLAGKEKHNA